MKVLVAGGGAVGSWFGTALAAGGVDVTLVARGPHVEAVRSSGLGRSIEGRVERYETPAYDSIAAAASRSPFDLVLVAVKSYHTAGVAAELAAVGHRGLLVSVQNGLGNEAVLEAAASGRELPSGITLSRVPAGSTSRTIAATLTTAVRLTKPGLVEQLGSSSSGVGLARGSGADGMASALGKGGLKVCRYSDPDSMKWSKVLLNMLGAATCAIVRRPPDELLARSDIFAIELDAWREALSVMRRLAVEPVKLPGYPVNIYATAVSLMPGIVLRSLFGQRLARARGSRMPGTASDIVAGRIDSEIRSMHGVIVDCGVELGLQTPTVRALHDLVVGVAHGDISPDRFIGLPSELARAVRSTISPAEALSAKRDSEHPNS